MNRFFGTISITVALCSSQIRADEVASTSIDEYLDACLEAEQFNGTVLVTRDGQRLACRGYGMANFEHEVANEPRTKFRLGSVTKQFTAMAIMILQDRGLLSVQDPIEKYVENSPDDWKAITIHHLLCHTSGIPNFTSFPDYLSTMRQPSTPAQTIGRFRDKPLEFTPGEKFAYSNSGYILLGVIIEKASGKTYEHFLREAIFEPLEMNDTGYDRANEVLKDRAAGYRRLTAIENAEFTDMSIPFAAGGLYSTVGDLQRWHEALLAGKLLSEQSMSAMFTPVKGDYAYGWGVHSRAGRRVVEHGGGINGFATCIFRIPDLKACIVVLSNFEGAPADRMARDLASILLGEPYSKPKARRVAQIDTKIYDDFVGRYQLAPFFVIEVTRDANRLLAQATGQPQFEVFPESETEFFLRVVDAQITFVRNAHGAVDRLILHQGGADQEAKRVAD